MKPAVRWAIIAIAILLVFVAAVVGPKVLSTNRSPSEQPTPAPAFERRTLDSRVDPYRPVIDLQKLGVRADQIDAVKLEQDGARVLRLVDVAGDRLVILADGAPAGSVLDLNKAYSLKLYTTDNARYQIDFRTSELPDITETNSRQVIYVPAMPEEGFHWPYYLAVPGKFFHELNAEHRRYLMVDITNTGSSNKVADMLSRTRTAITDRHQLSMSLADQLGIPMIYPAFPRPQVGYSYQGEANQFYTHALDRDTATLHVKMRDPEAATALTQAFQGAGFDVKSFLNLDLQLNAMIDHAITYLNQNGHKVEPKQVFLSGYSASGTFVDRYALLHPDRVKAVAAGATVDDMALPLAEHKGQNLIFPIGTSDYAEITGRPFDLNKFNQVARLIFMGEDDTNNTLPYSDCYGERERQIISSLFGADVLPRAHTLTKVFGESGGKGMIILDRKTQHSTSPAMVAYVRAFFEANRDTDRPVYPVPGDPHQLTYTLYK